MALGVPRDRIVRGAGRMTFLAGGAVVGAAWAVGGAGLPPAYLPVGAVLAEVLGCLAVVLAWRFRRSRLGLAAIMVVLVNALLRGPLDGAAGLELAALAILLPLNLSVLAMQRDVPLPRPGPVVHLALVLAQPWLVASLLERVEGASEAVAGVATWLRLVQEPRASLLAILIAVVVTTLVFALRRGAFEGALLWVVVAAAVAVHVASDRDRAALMLAAAQLILLVGLFEDSYRLAFHDQLTGLPGRRALDDQLRNLDDGYALAMVDVDHFKRFNDRYGHETGDQALRMVADELRAVGSGGRAFRYGGEEFVIVFQGRSVAEANEAAEEVREAIAARPFTIRSPKRPHKKPKVPRPAAVGRKKVYLTVSIGVAASTSRRPGPDDVLRAADRALYRAKGSGRNRVVKV